MDGVEASPLKLQHWTPPQPCVDKNAGRSLQCSPEENRQTRGIIFAQHETIGPDGAHEKKETWQVSQGVVSESKRHA
jgi:hypothetical protein